MSTRLQNRSTGEDHHCQPLDQLPSNDSSDLSLVVLLNSLNLEIVSLPTSAKVQSLIESHVLGVTNPVTHI